MAYAVVLLPFLLLLIANVVPRRVRFGLGYWGALALSLGEAAGAARYLLRPVPDALTAPLERLLGFGLAVDRMAALILLVAGIVFASVLLVGGTRRRDLARGSERRDELFIDLLLINLCGVNGIAMIADVFTLYVFIEVVAISSYVLITFAAGESFEGSFKYLIVSGIASVLMLSAVALLILTQGETSFTAVAAAMSGSSPLGHVAVALFLGGLFVKGGFVPFHFWVPDAYGAAPTSVAVLLSGIGTKASGVFALFRLAAADGGFPPAYREMLLVVGVVSVYAGAIAALGQRDMKRMLAYSSVSQVGYIILGLGAGNVIGFIGAAFHFFNHAVSSAQLFGNVAAVEVQSAARAGASAVEAQPAAHAGASAVEVQPAARAGASASEVRAADPADPRGAGRPADAGGDLVCARGITQQMPVTGVTAGIAALSTAGLPPLAGFWSKLFVLVGLWQAGLVAWAVVALLATVLTLAYFIEWQRVHFLSRPGEGAALREAGAPLVVTALVLAALTVAAGIAFPFVAGLFVR